MITSNFVFFVYSCLFYITYVKKKQWLSWWIESAILETRKLLNEVFLLVKLKSSLRKFVGHHHDSDDLVDRYGISVSQMTTDMSSMEQLLMKTRGIVNKK